MPIIIGARCGAQCLILGLPFGIIIAQRNQSGGSDGNSICPQRHGFGDIRAIANSARDDQLNFSVHPQILQRFYRRANAGQSGQADMFDKHILRGRCATLHPVNHHNICPRFHSKRCIKIRAGCAYLYVNRYFPLGNLAQFDQLDFKIVGAGPIRVPAGRALIDALWQIAHIGHAVRYFLAQKHSATAGFCPLPNHHFNRIGFAQIIGIHPIARR